ncbi:MAG: bifunctional folylpolyglutamate synthase/dihydrofolate synthase, partial [Alphaproteobacteria bacterium]
MTSPSTAAPRPGAQNADVSGSAAILRRMEALHPETIDLGLERVERLLERLDRPQDALPRVVHVAGTNGKGSFIAFLRAILEAAGARVHSFTSPHLVSFHERIALAGAQGCEKISEDALAALLSRVEQANGRAPITFFEITTAAAFLAFAETPADFLLLETGLGGRLDATNVVAQPALTAIMPVSLDHAHYLGDTIAAIAGEKAGILKPGAPCIVARQEPDALHVIEARAEDVGAPVIAAGQAWDVFEQHGRLVFQTGGALLDLPLPQLIGRHQIDNAGAAIAAALELIGTRADESVLAKGLQKAHWPARLQRIHSGALRGFVHEGTELLLDGGHNPAAAKTLACSMADLEERQPRPLHLICGMMENKDAAGFFAQFEGLAEWVACIPIPGRERGQDADALAAV